MSESIPTGNYVPYVLNLQSSDVPRNECDKAFILHHSWPWNCLEPSLNCFIVNSNFGHEGILKYLKRKIFEESEY